MEKGDYLRTHGNEIERIFTDKLDNKILNVIADRSVKAKFTKTVPRAFPLHLMTAQTVLTDGGNLGAGVSSPFLLHVEGQLFV